MLSPEIRDLMVAAPREVADMLALLKRCSDIVPGETCREVDLPSGTTYAKAARVMAGTALR